MMWKVTRNSFKIFTLIFRQHPIITLSWLVIPIMCGLLTYPVYSSRKDLITFTAQFLDMDSSFNSFVTGIYPTLLIIFIAGISQYVLLLVMNVHGIALKNKADVIIKTQIWKKVFSMKYSLLENKQVQDKLKRGTDFVGEQLLNFISSQTETIRILITLLSLFGIIFTINYWIAIILIVAAAPALLIKIRTEIAVKKLDRNTTTSGRKANYISSILTLPESAKEVRIFKYAPFLIKQWGEYLNQSLFARGELRRNEIKIGFIVGIINIIAFSVSLFLLVHNISYTASNIGNITITIWAIAAIQRMMFQIITPIQNFAISSLNAQDLVEFLEVEDTYSKSDVENNFVNIEGIQCIEFKNVSFRYSEGKTNILNNVNFTLNKGEKVAIVGENGSGKTTLVKLALGIYKPTSGEILINNIPLHNINLESIYQNASVVLQNFTKFPLSFKENIEVGSARGQENINLKRLNEFINEIGFADIIDNSPKGWDTILGNYGENSFDLSGGQWSLFALARTIIKKTDLVILDEISSSLDPLAEIEIFNNYNKLLSDELVLLISHRLGWARYADRILVMKEGNLVESGNHEELLRKKKEYYSLYSTQSSWYV
ncbi:MULTISPECIES: ABC transporter ATP-binding protein [Bacillus cereus group]|uniref:ABC transporter ATP-binding protein n=1 Tax=Bacillus cereus group TaxID=86661 RepID=UPI001F58E259|nr:ATP-binding cassette domain-containing protein [Bacillus pacificus]MED0823849.1 ATP-binding cassette domain-containing protein [Bacillus pacificus]